MAEAGGQEEHSKEPEQQQPEQPQEQPAADRQQKQTGVVKWFNATKGFGFITPDEGGEDLFVHQTCIDAEGFRSLREGEPVEFLVDVAEDGRTKAVKVTGPGGAAPQGAPRRPPVLQPPYGGRGRGMARGYPMEGYGLPAEGFGMYHEGFAMHPAGYPPPPAMYPPPPGYAAPPAFMRAPRGGRGGGRLGGRYAGRGRGPPGERRPPPGTPGVSSGLQVVVHNLPWACTWQTLKDAFAGTGNIERADVIFDSTGRSRGFGTVRFSSPEEAEAAVELMNEKQIEGRTVTVRIDRFA